MCLQGIDRIIFGGVQYLDIEDEFLHKAVEVCPGFLGGQRGDIQVERLSQTFQLTLLYA
ncbi:MAG TPA: hypothetical protein QF882_02175 [Arenicellales bacterium]|nr:hypothetical protein [Arenicellales bacterium]